MTSTLTFAGLDHNTPIDQSYGDRWDTTPNIVVDYLALNTFSRWDSYEGNNDAPPVNGWEGGVAQLQGPESFDLKLTPDGDIGVLVESFELVDYKNFAQGHTVEWSLIDSRDNTTIVAGETITLVADEEQSITTGMSEAYQGELTLRLDHIAGDNTDLAIDNIVFTQEGEAEIPIPSIRSNNINDLLLGVDAAPTEIDLTNVFGEEATDFAVTTSNDEVVDATITDDVLSLTSGTLGHSDLFVTATSADGAPLEENFRAIVAGENAYTFAVFPDTQSYTSTESSEVRALFGEMSDWLLDQQESLAIQHMIHVGDIVEFGAFEQWEIAEEAIEKLDGQLTYTLNVGNHDQQVPGVGSAETFDSRIDLYFTPEQVGATPAQGGGLYDGEGYTDSIRNNYTTLTTPDGTNWLILSLEFGAPDDVLRWASEVIEDHLDHRVIVDTHSWNGGDKRVDPTTEPLTGENGGWGYGIRQDPRNVNDGEDMWRELVSKYPNITFTFNGHNFLDGAETVVSNAAGDNPVFQIMVNYQNGISGEITGAGDPTLGGRGGNGAMRLVVIDPDNDRISTHTKFVELDKYFDRVDHEEVFEGVDLGAPEQIAIAKAGGTMVFQGDEPEVIVSLDPSATLGATAGTVFEWFATDGEKLGETDGEALDVPLKAGMNRLTLRVTDAEGNVSEDQKLAIVETPGTLLSETFDDGDFNGWVAPGSTPNETSFLVKGSIFGNPNGEGEAALYAQTDDPNEILLWNGEDAQDWSNYVYDLTLEAADNDTVGAIFYYVDEQNHYELALNQEEDTRTLTRVENGVATILAEESGSYRHLAPQDLRIAVVNDQITVTLDEDLLFDGPVTDSSPLAAGTVGVLSRSMDRASFDNIAVNTAELSARVLGETPAEQWAVDLDGDGTAIVNLSAQATISVEEIASYEWLVNDTVVETGVTGALALEPGETTVTLRVTDALETVSEDQMTVSVAPQAAVLAADDFNDGTADGWTIVDEGPIDPPSDWAVVNDAFSQNSNIQSTQQESGFGAWSLGGEGAYILRDGTYAVYNAPEALAWTDYTLEATINPGDNDEGVGLLFRYIDSDNYYKLEADPLRGVIQLTRHEDGYETVLARGWHNYTPGEAQDWRIEVDGTTLTPYINGVEVFGSEVDDQIHEAGTVALYSWASEGVSFDNVTVLDKGEIIEGEIIEGTDDDDELVGGQGNDTIAGLLGNDEIEGRGGDDVLRGDLNTSNPQENIDGGNDTINGGSGDDEIGGKAGDDELYGDEGNDEIWGDDGDDLLRGGLGDDILTGDDFSGGSGADTFILAVGEGTDTITDFEVGTDFIGLAEGLSFDALSFSESSIMLEEETLAVLNGIDTTTLTEDDFTSV